MVYTAGTSNVNHFARDFFCLCAEVFASSETTRRRIDDKGRGAVDAPRPLAVRVVSPLLDVNFGYGIAGCLDIQAIGGLGYAYALQIVVRCGGSVIYGNVRDAFVLVHLEP